MRNGWSARTLVLIWVSAAALLSAADLKIVINAGPRYQWATTKESLAGYHKAAPEAKLVVAESPGVLADEIVDADAVIGDLPRELLPRARKLRWVQEYSAGVEDYHYPEFINSDIVLTNCKIAQGPTIADHAFGLLLSLTRGLNRHIANRENQEWDRDGTGLIELSGKTAVVIGVGGIGSQIAQRAHGFGMKVIGVDPKDIAPSNVVSMVVRPDQLNDVLPEADVVFVSAPHTPESEHMMGPQQFDLMKKGAYFIAVSRGKLYDSAALVKALDTQKLAGAGLDVTDPEPLPKDHALWKFRNVVITPHIASQAPGSHVRRVAVITENLERFTTGRPLINVVDKRRGY